MLAAKKYLVVNKLDIQRDLLHIFELGQMQVGQMWWRAQSKAYPYNILN